MRFNWTVVPALTVAGLISGGVTEFVGFDPQLGSNGFLFMVVGSCAFAFGVSAVLVIRDSVQLRTAGIVVGATIAAHVFMFYVWTGLKARTYGFSYDSVVFSTFLIVALPLFVTVLLVTSGKKLAWALLIAPVCALGGALTTAYVNHTQEHALISFLLGTPLFLTWQVNLALFLGIALWLHGTLGAEIRTDPLEVPSVSRGAVLGILVLFAALLGIWDVHEDNEYSGKMKGTQEKIQAGTAKSISEAPPSTNLPPVEARPIAEVFLMNAIGDWRPYGSGSLVLDKPTDATASSAGVKASWVPCPTQLMSYSVSYSHPGSDFPATVRITEYPNSDWARYEVRNTPTPNEAIEHPDNFQSVIKFGNRLYQDGAAYFWSSTNRLILLDHQGHYAAETDDLLESYLAKYPSSL